MNDLKQVIVVRADLNMPQGKMAAQVAHASIAFLKAGLFINFPRHGLNIQINEVERLWLFDGVSKKVVVKAQSEKGLDSIHQRAKDAGLQVHVITDLGRTVFNGEPTKTCLAIGPDTAERIDAITKHLKLY